MNFRSLIRNFKGFTLSQVKTPLGRWDIHNHNQTMLKNTYANEDNCGVSYNNYKHTIQIQENNKLNDDEFKYMMGYESITSK